MVRNLAYPDIMATASPTLFAKGSVNVIGFDGIKIQAGDRWPRICDSVCARLESLLHASLGPGDFSARIDDAAYLVAMPSSDPSEVNIVCLRAVYNMYNYFLGQCSFSHIQIANASCGSDNTLVLSQLSDDQIVNLAKQAGIDAISTPDRRSGTTVLPSLSTLNGRALNGVTDVAVHHGVAPAPPGLVVQHGFFPVWNASRSMLLTYICEPKAIQFDGRRMQAAQLPTKERRELELYCFREGIEQYARSAAMYVRFLLGVEISFEVLGSPVGRRDVISICRSIPYEFRDFVVFLLTEVPPGVAQSRLSGMVTLLKPFGRRVSATIAPHMRISAAYQGIGLHSIGFDMREFSPYDPFLEDDGEWLGRTRKKLRLRSFLLSVSDMHTLDIARGNGIDYMCGPAILPICPEPFGIRRLSWNEISEQTVFKF